MSAITAALSQIDRVASEGDLAPDRAVPLELEAVGEPILLPDGKRIYPPSLHGQPVDELALALLDMGDPSASTFLRLSGPPGAGKSQIARAIAYRLRTGRGRAVSDRHGVPFYGFVELQPTSRQPGKRSSPSPDSPSCSPTTRGSSGRPTSPTRGTPGSTAPPGRACWQ